MLVDQAEAEVGWVEVVADWLLGHHDRLCQETALGADLNPLRSRRCRIGNSARRIPILVRWRYADRNHFDLGAVINGHRAVTQDSAGSAGRRRGGLVRSHVKLEVEETVVGGVQDPEPISLWLHFQVGVCSAVHQGSVKKALARHGGIWNSRPHGRFPGSGTCYIRWFRLANWLVVFVGNRTNFKAPYRSPVNTGGYRRIEPGSIVPAPKTVGAGKVPGILDRHIDMGIPEGSSVRSPIPGRILGVDCVGVHEGLVLDDQGDADVGENFEVARVDAGHIGSVDHILVHGICDHVPGCFARIYIKTSDGQGMVVVELQPGALGIGVK